MSCLSGFEKKFNFIPNIFQKIANKKNYLIKKHKDKYTFFSENNGVVPVQGQAVLLKSNNNKERELKKMLNIFVGNAHLCIRYCLGDMMASGLI